MINSKKKKREKHKILLKQVDKYYTQKLKKYGATNKGVDWNSQESQELRFEQLLKITNGEQNASVVDYGCGYGALARYMRKLGYKGRYTGYDISDAMIKEAKKRQSDLGNCKFVKNINSLSMADYTVASGIFDVKGKISNEKWMKYVLDTVNSIAKLSKKGFSFNVLTKYVDYERPDLFYADPCFFLDHLIRNYTRNVALLHNYGLYEFTALVRLK